MGREYCLYTEVNAAKVPPRQRREFVAMTVRRAAPYPDPEFGLAWLGDHAAVWYWSRSKVRELLGGEWTPRTTCVPEALYTGQVHPDADEVLALSQGCEGRLWKHDGRLLASRWWAQSPSPAQWQGFLRGAGIAATADMQAPEAITATPPAEQRWQTASTRSRLALAGLDAYLPRLFAGLGLAVLVLFSWQIGTALRAGVDILRTRQAAQDLDEPLKRILAARDRADAAQGQAASLLTLRGGPSQHRLLAEATRVMGNQDWQLKVWQQPVPDRVEATLIMDSPDPEAVVAAWEASPLFSDVRTELSRNQSEIVVRATVVNDQEALP